jgi:hypothetical protein
MAIYTREQLESYNLTKLKEIGGLKKIPGRSSWNKATKTVAINSILAHQNEREEDAVDMVNELTADQLRQQPMTQIKKIAGALNIPGRSTWKASDKEKAIRLIINRRDGQEEKEEKEEKEPETVNEFTADQLRQQPMTQIKKIAGALNIPGRSTWKASDREKAIRLIMAKQTRVIEAVEIEAKIEEPTLIHEAEEEKWAEREREMERERQERERQERERQERERQERERQEREERERERERQERERERQERERQERERQERERQERERQERERERERQERERYEADKEEKWGEREREREREKTQVVEPKTKCDIRNGLRYLNKLLEHKKQRDTLKGILTNAVELDRETYEVNVLNQINNYFLTDKADGVRTIAFINPQAVRLINHECVQFSPKNYPQSNNSIIEGELVNDIFYAYDILVHEGSNMTKEPFHRRLDVLRNIQQTNSFRIKNYIRLNKNSFCEQIMGFYRSALNGDTHIFTSSSYAVLDGDTHIFTSSLRPNDTYFIDGMIFTSANGNYRNTKHFKWKPLEHMTVDVLCKEIPGKGKYALFVGADRKEHEKRSQTAENVNITNRFFSRLNGNEYHPFLVKLIDKEIPHLDGRIVEFKFARGTLEWEFVRIREDRQPSDNYFGNDIKILDRILKNYSDPLTLHGLCGGYEHDSVYPPILAHPYSYYSPTQEYYPVYETGSSTGLSPRYDPVLGLVFPEGINANKAPSPEHDPSIIYHPLIDEQKNDGKQKSPPQPITFTSSPTYHPLIYPEGIRADERGERSERSERGEREPSLPIVDFFQKRIRDEQKNEVGEIITLKEMMKIMSKQQSRKTDDWKGELEVSIRKSLGL